MRSINEISPEKQSQPWERGICSLTDPSDPNASPTGGGAGNRDFRLGGNYCNALVASSFEGLENSGFMGSGGFRPPNLEFAARRNACVSTKLATQQKTGSGGMTPAASGAPVQIPIVYIVIAILFLLVVLK